jgi:hypothetical protein
MLLDFIERTIKDWGNARFSMEASFFCLFEENLILKHLFQKVHCQPRWGITLMYEANFEEASK